MQRLTGHLILCRLLSAARAFPSTYPSVGACGLPLLRWAVDLRHAKQLLELNAEKSNLVVSIGARKDTAANVGFALGRVASKSIKATREKMNKP